MEEPLSTITSAQERSKGTTRFCTGGDLHPTGPKEGSRGLLGIHLAPINHQFSSSPTSRCDHIPVYSSVGQSINITPNCRWIHKEPHREGGQDAPLTARSVVYSLRMMSMARGGLSRQLGSIVRLDPLFMLAAVGWFFIFFHPQNTTSHLSLGPRSHPQALGA